MVAWSGFGGQRFIAKLAELGDVIDDLDPPLGREPRLRVRLGTRLGPVFFAGRLLRGARAVAERTTARLGGGPFKTRVLGYGLGDQRALPAKCQNPPECAWEVDPAERWFRSECGIGNRAHFSCGLQHYTFDVRRFSAISIDRPTAMTELITPGIPACGGVNPRLIPLLKADPPFPPMQPSEGNATLPRSASLLRTGPIISRT